MTVDPAKLRIQIYPAEILRTKADEVDPTPEVRAVAERMIDLMRGADGIGLAATQAGLAWRMFVAELGPDPDAASGHEDYRVSTDGPEVYLNPVIEEHDGGPTLFEEGCLSLPGIRGELPRPPSVTMSWFDLSGERHTAKATGLLARCWQHEIDHLDGVMIIDRFTQLSRTKNRSAIKSLEKSAR
ncbi:MAG: peptide deformylase [Planctomycetota bacterium]